MSNGSLLSWEAKLSLVCIQIHPLALMMQKYAWLYLSMSRLKTVWMEIKMKYKDLKKDWWSKLYVFRWKPKFNQRVYFFGGSLWCGDASIYSKKRALNVKLCLKLLINGSLMCYFLWRHSGGLCVPSGVFMRKRWLDRQRFSSSLKKEVSSVTGTYQNLLIYPWRALANISSDGIANTEWVWSMMSNWLPFVGNWGLMSFQLYKWECANVWVYKRTKHTTQPEHTICSDA